jgi:hypothetical protein
MKPRATRGVTLVVAAIVTVVLGACHGRDPGRITVHGTVTTHPENDCRFATSGSTRGVLGDVPIVFTDPASRRSYRTTTDPRSVRTDEAACRQTAVYRITLPPAPAYIVNVLYYPVFGGLPTPVRVTLGDLKRERYRLDLAAEPSTGE